jgi:Protein of unknown function (DUF2723)
MTHNPIAKRNQANATGVPDSVLRFIQHPDRLIGLAFLILYTFTLAPGVLPADSGEYQVTGAVLGVAHPPGFALYTMTSWLISRLPGIPPAVAINFLSALLAAGALALLCRAVRGLSGSALAGVVAAAALGLSTTFWAQATTANIRMPAAFALAWALERLVAYRAAVRAQQPPGSLATRLSLALFSLAAGVGISHHASLAFLMVILAIYVVWLRPAVLRRPWPLLLGLLPLAAWLYFPLRAGAFGAPPRIATLDGFLEHVLARGFAGDLFFFANAAALPDRLRIFVNILTFEFVGPALLLMALGAVAAIVRLKGLGWALLAATAVHVLISITYRAPQTVEYLLPAYVLMGAWVGLGLAEVNHWLGRALSGRAPAWLPVAAAGAIGALAILAQGLVTFPSYQWLAHDNSTRDYAEAVLGGAPHGAVILSSWNWATPMWYLQQVEGQRPDVEVRYVTPSGPSLAQNWVRQITATTPTHPVVVTSFFQSEYRALPLHFIPLGPAWLASSVPLTQPSPGLTGAQSFGDWAFLGYRVDSVSAQEAVVTAAWQTSAAATGDVSVYVHLLDPAGQLHSQMDVQHPAGSYAAGEVLLDRYSLPLRPDAKAGGYQLVSGVYRTADGVNLASVALPIVQVPPQPLSNLSVPAGAVPLGNAIWLTGSAVRGAVSLGNAILLAGSSARAVARPGDTLQVDLDFLAARPITADDTVSVAIVGPNYQWQALSDGTPAGGAIPTLKWIAGSRISDTHRLMIPADAALGTASLSLTLYDAFTQRIVPVLDRDLAARGQSVPLGTIEIVAP